MIRDIVDLAGADGLFGWMGVLEIAAFTGAGLLPLLLIWKSAASYRKTLLVIWGLCFAYVSLLALNLLRLGLFAKASVRLVVWSAMAVLLVRTLQASRRNA
jgi:hypothetical protein